MTPVTFGKTKLEMGRGKKGSTVVQVANRIKKKYKKNKGMKKVESCPPEFQPLASWAGSEVGRTSTACATVCTCTVESAEDCWKREMLQKYRAMRLEIEQAHSRESEGQLIDLNNNIEEWYEAPW